MGRYSDFYVERDIPKFVSAQRHDGSELLHSPCAVTPAASRRCRSSSCSRGGRSSAPQYPPRGCEPQSSSTEDHKVERRMPSGHCMILVTYVQLSAGRKSVQDTWTGALGHNTGVRKQSSVTPGRDVCAVPNLYRQRSTCQEICDHNDSIHDLC